MSRVYREAKGDILWIIDCNVWASPSVAGRMVDLLCEILHCNCYCRYYALYSRQIEHVPAVTSGRLDHRYIYFRSGMVRWTKGLRGDPEPSCISHGGAISSGPVLYSCQRLHYFNLTHILHLEDHPITRYKLQHRLYRPVNRRRILHRHLHQLPHRYPEILPTHRPQNNLAP